MKTENLIILGALAIGGYLLWKSGALSNFGEGFASGGGGSGGGGSGGGGSTIQPIIPGSGSGIVLNPQEQVTRYFNPPPAITIPLGIVANVPAGIVKGSGGRIEGVLIKGKTDALFFNPGAKQTAGFLNAVVSSGRTLPLNKSIPVKAPAKVNPFVAIKNKSGR
jgi:hypothetical protein